MNDEKTNSPCKICHLNISGELKSKDYDQQIMNLICCEEKTETMRGKMDQVKVQEQGFYIQKNSSKQVKVFCWGLNDKDQLGGMKGSKVSI